MDFYIDLSVVLLCRVFRVLFFFSLFEVGIDIILCNFMDCMGEAEIGFGFSLLLFRLLNCDFCVVCIFCNFLPDSFFVFL